VSKTSNNEKLVKVKLELAAKYERLAKLTPSVPKRAALQRNATHYRRQAEILAR
jgi:hypothetical protein